MLRHSSLRQSRQPRPLAPLRPLPVEAALDGQCRPRGQPNTYSPECWAARLFCCSGGHGLLRIRRANRHRPGLRHCEHYDAAVRSALPTLAPVPIMHAAALSCRCRRVAVLFVLLSCPAAHKLFGCSAASVHISHGRQLLLATTCLLQPTPGTEQRSRSVTRWTNRSI